LIPQEEYIRIVLGMKSLIRQMNNVIGDLPLQVDQRRDICSKLHRLSDDIHTLYMNLKDQGLVE